MIITKKFKGEDGIERMWGLDSESKILTYRGLAKDFQNNSECKEVDKE